MGTITDPFKNIAINHPSLHLVVSPQQDSNWLGKQSARVREELLPSKVNSFPDLCLRRAMCISEVQTTSAPVIWALLTSKQVYIKITSVAGSSALPSTVLISLGYSSLPNKCYDLGTITKEVSWYTITFISKLCVKKMKSSKISVCLQEGTHPYCFLTILLIFPVHQKTVLAKLWDFRNIYFVHKSKQLQSLNSLWLNSLFCLPGWGGGVQQDNLCENGMANLSQSTESLQPLCAAWWWTSAMVHVTGNLQHGTCFKPLLSTKQSTRLFHWQNGSLLCWKYWKVSSLLHFIWALIFLYLEPGEQERGLERKLFF